MWPATVGGVAAARLKNYFRGGPRGYTPGKNPEKKSGSALAFSSAEKLLKFMKANLGGEWKMQMADDRDGLVVLIADLHRLEIVTLSLDPKNDGSGGEQVPLSDLVVLADSLR